MALFSKRKTVSEMVAIFDVGSRSVGGAMVLLPTASNKGKIKFLSTCRLPIKLKENVEFEILLYEMLKTLEEVAKQIKSEGNPQKVFCFLASPWYAGQTRIIKFSEPTSFVFTEEIYNTLIKKELVAAKGEDRIIESASINIALNGYSTSYPLGKVAKFLEMALFVGTSPERVSYAIEEKLKELLQVPAIQLSSFLLALFTVTRDLNSHQNDFLILDIGGEVTDVALVRENILVRSCSFPMGKSFFIRKIAERLKRTQEEAASLFALYLTRQIEEKIYRKIDTVVGHSKEEWLLKLEAILLSLANNLSLPAAVFLTADDDVAPFFRELIQAEKLTQYHLTESKFDVTILDARLLHHFCDFAYTVVERDPFLILEAMYLNR